MSTYDVVPPPLIGGRYTLGSLIGRGGAADVFQARDELLGREVAIKMFSPGTEVDADAVDGSAGPGSGSGHGSGSGSGPAASSGSAGRSGSPAAEAIGDLEGGQEARHRREVLTLAGLSHPGLVTVYDVGDEEGRAYFVMQLIEGDTLGQRIRGGPLAVADVVAVGAALADALAYVHRRGVVHRDVKPGNVLLDGEGRAHLSDFGIAAVRDAAPVTAAGMVIGTASYLSPEQVRGEPVGPAVDVYALGLVLIECLTGRREYPGQALEAAVARLHRRPVVPPRLPDGLAALLTDMTADDPSARPSAEDVVVALREVSRSMGMEAETVLSPMLATGTTTTGIGARTGAGGVLAAGAGAAAVAADPVPTGASISARPHRRRAAVIVGVTIAAVLAAGSAMAYALVASSDVAPLPPQVASSVPAPMPPGPPLLGAPTTTTEAERATATRARRTTPRTTVPTTTTTRVLPAPVPPPVVVTPSPPATTEPVVPPADPTTTTRRRVPGVAVA